MHRLDSGLAEGDALGAANSGRKQTIMSVRMVGPLGFGQ
jgi:hypothetical protein